MFVSFQTMRRCCVPGALFLLIVPALLMLSGCASTGDVENIKAQVALQTANERKQIDDLKASVSDLSRDMASLKEQGFGALKESQSSLFTQVSDLSKDIQVLQGRFDESKYSMDKTVRDLLTEKDVLQARIAGLENEVKELKTKLTQLATNPPAPSEKKEAPATPGEEQKEKAASPVTDYTVPQKLYDDAQIDYKEKNYGEAREKFEKFINDFPKHTLVANASFWIGETYYEEKKYEDAILAYENFLKKYPSHDKVKGAMLKQAYAFIEIGDKKTGKVILERLIEKFPQSNEAELAEKKIAEVLASGPSGSSASGNGKSKKKKKK